MSENTPKPKPKLLESRDQYTIGIICALPKEARAVRAAFDFTVPPREQLSPVNNDRNAYSYGTMGKYHVVLAHLSEMGKSNARGAAENMSRSFPNIKLCLLVGICGIVPKISGRETILGDVVVSTMVKQYDFGRQNPTGFEPKSTVEASLRKAPPELGNFISYLKASDEELSQYTLEHLMRLEQKAEELKADENYALADYLYPFSREDSITDALYPATYVHKHRYSTCMLCDEDKFCQDAADADCSDLNCDTNVLLPRKRLQKIEDILETMPEFTADRQEKLAKLMPRIHLGDIASGDAVMKDGSMRDEKAARHKIVAFEMEGAGVWDSLPTVVVKGACDYGDSHKNKKFQEYASLTAAACAKALLEVVQMGIPRNVEPEGTEPPARSPELGHHAAHSNGGFPPASHSGQDRVSNVFSGNFSGSNFGMGQSYTSKGDMYIGSPPRQGSPRN